MVDEIAVNPIDEQVTDMLPIDDGGIIDSTQNAIIGAAENVSQVLDAGKSVVQTHIHEIPFYTEVRFWIGVAFVLAMLVLLKPAYKFIKGALQKRVDRVLNDIDEAVKLRDDAQELLANYERKFVNVEQEAKQILEQGAQSLQRLQEAETARMKSDLKNKEKEAERRIKSSTEKAKSEINLSASRLSVNLARKAIDKYLQENDKSKLVDDAIDELDKFIKAS
jgi:F-type H+-transporting ATPase subunit b